MFGLAEELSILTAAALAVVRDSGAQTFKDQLGRPPCHRVVRTVQYKRTDRGRSRSCRRQNSSPIGLARDLRVRKPRVSLLLRSHPELGDKRRNGQ